MSNIIPVIDIFAGPGGLGEGFSSFKASNSQKFKIALSIEKDKFAHSTLLLRSFFRKFSRENVPEEYYSRIRGEIATEDLERRYKNEFVGASREAWQATLGGTDPSADEIDSRIKEALLGAKKWVLTGGPPCQAYSLVGRSRRGGIDPEDPRVYLYREYYRILAVHSPPIFIMENVKGLLSTRVDGDLLFKQILNDLRDPARAYHKLNGSISRKLECDGYYIYSLVKKPDNDDLFDSAPNFKSNDFVIRSEEYGIPQSRHRVILLGIRKGINIEPDILARQKTIPVREVLAGLPRLRSGISRIDGKSIRDDDEVWLSRLKDLSSNGILDGGEEKVVTRIRNMIQKLNVPGHGRGNEFIRGKANSIYNKEWFLDDQIEGVCNHSTRSHLDTDLVRYLYAAIYAQVNGTSPKLRDFPEKLLPAHQNANEAVETGKFADRFRVHLKNEPAKTITSHISKDGHYYIHYDPTQCRSDKLTTRDRTQTTLSRESAPASASVRKAKRNSAHYTDHSNEL